MSNYLYLLFLLSCPLMMIFMRRGMHGGHDTGAENKEREEFRVERASVEGAARRR